MVYPVALPLTTIHLSSSEKQSMNDPFFPQKADCMLLPLNMQKLKLDFLFFDYYPLPPIGNFWPHPHN